MKKKVISKHIEECCCGCNDGKWNSGACGGVGYCLGVIGAAVYYISSAGGFWMGFLGLLKALVWPAFLVFEILKFLGV
ncbi:MAG: hypothetical protein AABW79_03285 [Nanoarchaeota archaeon]